VICPHCDFIVDASFLGDDILQEAADAGMDERTIEEALKKLSSDSSSSTSWEEQTAVLEDAIPAPKTAAPAAPVVAAPALTTEMRKKKEQARGYFQLAHAELEKGTQARARLREACRGHGPRGARVSRAPPRVDAQHAQRRGGRRGPLR
jgi:hypothetical protein